jgi:hypothetical protein
MISAASATPRARTDQRTSRLMKGCLMIVAVGQLPPRAAVAQ